MKADIGRVTFEPDKHYQRVVMQQGRVQLESDWNEQIAILLLGARRLAADLIGPWGGSPGAFEVEVLPDSKNDFSIGAGRYYVDGIPCENEPQPGTTVSYVSQPYFPVPDDELLTKPDTGQNHYLAYVDVWELLVTAAEDENLREVALGGPDTAARTQVVWQARVAELAEEALTGITCADMPARWPALLELIERPHRGRLRARAKVTDAELDRPCAIDPRAAYRFDENALIRVEVHTPGTVGTATFKWSLDNGAVVFAVERFAGKRVALASLGRDARLTLQAGDWVELEHDAYVLQNEAEALFVVESVDYADLTVTLDRAPTPVAAPEHPRLRRWDQKGTNKEPLEPDGTVKIKEEGDASDPWIALRHGVQIQLSAPPSDGPQNEYRTGDFWLIPARTATGDVVWPREQDGSGGWVPAALPPSGVEHHYAPLAYLIVDDAGISVQEQFVREIVPLAKCPSPR
jgi:hypothetical protein